MEPDSPLELAIKLIGGPAIVAELRGMKTQWGVRKWLKDGLPAEHALWLAERTGWRVTPHQLAPELYPYPDDGLPQLFRKAARRAADEAAA